MTLGLAPASVQAVETDHFYVRVFVSEVPLPVWCPLTLAQLTGRETVLRSERGILGLSHLTNTLGGAREASRVHGGFPHRDA